MHVYVEFRCQEEALFVFHRLPRYETIACNAILRGYIDSGQFARAIHFFFNHLVVKLGFVPDNYTCPLILKACSRLADLEQGRKVIELIRFNEAHHNFKPNTYTKCALIDMLTKCGSLDAARMVFDDMPQTERDLASWTAVISGTVQNGEWLEALSLYRRMRVEGVRPDSMTVSALLPACGRFEAKKAGMALHGCAVRSGFYCDSFVSNGLMDMYCKFGDTGEAWHIFCTMSCKDMISWSILIAGYLQNCEYGKCIELYFEMKNLGVKPNAVTTASVLSVLGKLNLSKQGKEMHGYILKQRFDIDVVVGSALIDMYANCSLIREAEMMFGIMSDRDIMVWNSMIAGCASTENIDSAFRIFRKIWESECKPNSITLMSVLPLCAKMGVLGQGKVVHCHAIRNGLMVVSVRNSLIDMYCKCGFLELGVKVFDHMMERNVISYNTIISAYGIHGCGKQALALFDQMKSLAIKPTEVTFVGLLSACSHAGLIRKGWSLYTSMINDYGMLPNMEHYSCMVDLLGRAGNIADACNFIKRMPEEPNGYVLGSLLAACRVHDKVELVDLLASQIVDDKLEDSGYHILLSNIYASMKRWEDSSRFRTLMKEKGLIKKPGKSWIQICNHTHIFKARDTSHPEFKKIIEVLEILLSEMTIEWCMLDQYIIPSP